MKKNFIILENFRGIKAYLDTSTSIHPTPIKHGWTSARILLLLSIVTKWFHHFGYLGHHPFHCHHCHHLHDTGHLQDHCLWLVAHRSGSYYPRHQSLYDDTYLNIYDRWCHQGIIDYERERERKGWNVHECY